MKKEEKKKPKGKAVVLPEAKSDEAAKPDDRDMQRADDLAAIDPFLLALWNAEPYEPEK